MIPYYHFQWYIFLFLSNLYAPYFVIYLIALTNSSEEQSPLFTLRGCALKPALGIVLSPSSWGALGGRQARGLAQQWWRGFRQAVLCTFLLSPSSHSFGLLPELPGSRSALCDLVALSHTWVSEFKLKLIAVKWKLKFSSSFAFTTCGLWLLHWTRQMWGISIWQMFFWEAQLQTFISNSQTTNSCHEENSKCSRVSILFIWAQGRGAFKNIFHCSPHILQNCFHLQPSYIMKR